MRKNIGGNRYADIGVVGGAGAGLTAALTAVGFYIELLQLWE